MKNNLLKIYTVKFLTIIAIAVFGAVSTKPVYAAEGDALWAKSAVTNPSYSVYTDVYTDSLGNSYVVGEVDGTGTLDLGNGATITADPNGVGILAKYDAYGTIQWARSQVSGGGFEFNSVTGDGNGNIYVIGSLYTVGTYDFGNSVTATGEYSNGTMVIIKYNTAGVAQWARTASYTADMLVIAGIATDANGNVYATVSQLHLGGAHATIDFGNGITHLGTSDGFEGLLVKYNSSGVTQWLRSYTSVSGGTSPFIAFEQTTFTTAGDYYVKGTFSGNADFGNSVTLTNLHGWQQSFIVKYNASGVAQWANTAVSSAAEPLYDSFVLDAQGNVYIAGSLYGNAEFDFGNNVKVTAITTGPNAFVMKYNSSGVAQWAETPTAADVTSRFIGITIDGSGNIYPVGELRANGSATFGTGVTLTGVHEWGNGIVVKYNSSGVAQWGNAPSAAINESRFVRVARDAFDNLYVVGELDGLGAFNFGNGVTVNATSPDEDASNLIIKYSGGVAAVSPTVTTSAATNAGATTATVPGNVTSDGGALITERGVVYSSSNNTPTTSDSKQTTTGTTGAMSVSLTGLSLSTQYYARAYATNSVGTSYGSVVTFTTLASANAPTVTTTAQIPAYGATTAQVLGNVTADGGATVTERGVVYSSTNNTPTTSDSKQTVTGTTGAMTVQLSGLTPYTTYYVRAYATNSAGTGYGAVVTFRTIPMTLQNVYFTFGKLQYGKYAAPSTVRAGDTIYLKNFDPKKIQLLAISLYDYTTKGNQCYTRSWISATSMSMRTCGLLPTKRKYAFIFTFKDVATGVTVKKYFVINTISAGTITL